MQGSTRYYLHFFYLSCCLPYKFMMLLQEVLYCAKRAGVTHILKAGGAQVWLWSFLLCFYAGDYSLFL